MQKFVILFLTLLFVNFTSSRDQKLYSNTWALEVDGGEEEANRIAEKYGYINLGKVGNLKDIFHFKHKTHPRRSRRSLEDETKLLYEETTVKWAEQQVIKRRVKREYNTNFNDPLYTDQWYLHNTNPAYRGFDHNVLPVWKQGVFGKDVVVSILDDGIEMTHRDLAPNYDPKASFDYNDNDADPTPRRTFSNENRHGTRCAGEVAAVFNNSVCIVGVAPKSKIGGVRMLDGDVTDAVEASSLSLNPQHIEVYSASWGPDDDGKTVDGPGCLARAAFNDGITKGRHGLGSIYVWASGNGGRVGDSCNCDGYTNSIYTLSISSANERGKSPWYSESCSSTLATTFSSGQYAMKQIVTTDLDNRCTKSHTGTSASAPIAAGILALALEVNRNLTWRDMQHLVVRTSKMDKLLSHDIVHNGVGRPVSHKFGYGLLDAMALVQLARAWKTVPAQHVCHELPDEKQRIIPTTGTLLVEKRATGCTGTNNEVKYLEHVEAVISLSFSKRGDLVIYLTSPSGTRSTLLAKRVRDYDHREGFNSWAFMTTHCWGENPKGKWTLEVRNDGDHPYDKNGTVKTWSLRFYGTSHDPDPNEKHYNKPVSACDVECENGCKGPAPNECSSCINYRRTTTGDCVSSCIKREFARSKECLPCSPTCKTCSGPTSSDCTSCLSPLLLMNNTCVNLCPTSWFKSKDRCAKCDPSCLTCTGKATQCTSCKTQHKLVDFSCQPFCSAGFFKKGDKCVACHSSCSECTKEGPQECTRCSKGLYFRKGECIKSCPPGLFGDAVTQQCMPCHSTCSSCSGRRNDDCLTCSTGLYRAVEPRGLCQKTCPQGRYPDPDHGTCIRCGTHCATCDKRNPSQCTSCVDNKYLDNYECVYPQNCSRQSYPNAGTKTCDKCYGDCLTCTGPAADQCLSCIKGFYVYKSQCVLRCPVTTFPSNNSCQSCPKHCTSCYGTSKDQCLSCESSFVLSESQCVSQCPIGAYKHHITKDCVRCHPSCKSCSGGADNNCLSCKDGYALNGTACLSKCPKGEVSTSTSCTKCHSSCSSCHGTTNKDCMSCSGVKFLDMKTNTCSYQCPEGFYGEVKTAICKACPVGCKTCKEAGKCGVCETGLVKNGDICESHCPEGMHVSKDSNTCTKCEPSCLECLGTSNNCIKCHNQNFLNENKCISVCPTGSYHHTQSNRCGKCDTLCAECSGPSSNECTKCPSGLLKEGKTCLRSCQSGYFYSTETRQCDPCDYLCQECKHGNGLKNCSKCISPFVLHFHYCVRECPSNGWFLDTTMQKCKKCDSSCSTCVGPTSNHCTACSDPNAVLYGFKCKLQCPEGYFKNFRTHQCERCHPTCVSCAGMGSSACTSCVSGLRLRRDNQAMGKCISDCKPCQYKTKSSNCLSCHSSCKSCYGPTNTNCLSCLPGLVYYQNTCRKNCPVGTFFRRNFIQECVKCHPLCETCTGAMPSQCSSCQQSLFLEQSTCVIQCSSKTKPDLKNKLCKPCKECEGKPGKPRNRSVQDPSIATIKFLLDDPQKNGMLAFAVMSVGLCVSLFFIVLGVLQLRSTRHLCFKTKYTIIKANFNHGNEDEQSLMDNDMDNDEEA